jgi:chaperonin GroEL
MDSELIKELYIHNEAKEKLIEGITKLSEVVLATMGPMGRTIIISDEYGRPYVTKDGVSVANAVKFKDPVENIGAKLIKQVAQKTADEAGDGTTTSICLAQQFIFSGTEVLENGVNVNKLSKEIDALVKDVVEELKKISKPLEIKDVHKVATISANNDEKIGEVIQQAYNHSVVVKVEEGKLKEDVVEIIDGMVHPITYHSPKFINNEKKKEVSYEEANVLVLDKKLEDLTPYRAILEACSNKQEPLIIFTEFVSENVLKLLETNFINDYIKVAAVKAPGFGSYRRDNLADIAEFTGARVITSDTALISPSVLGKATNISIGKLQTVIGKPSHIDLTKKIEDLKEQYQTADISDYDREFVLDRIKNLNGTLSVIKVGGTSEVEMKERKDRIDDAVLAVKSALEEGIVEGGGLALVRVSDTLYNKRPSDVRKTLFNVLLAPSSTIFLNSSGTINCEDFDINRFDQNIIDPLKVTRCAFENAASVAKTILSTEAVVLNEHLWR